MSITKATRAMARLLETMARLRGPDGCPWDAGQTPQSLRPYLIEETYEVLDAIDRDDTAALREELGDLLLQIVFHARIAEERGEFDMADLTECIVDKLVRRHPHVFAGQAESDPEILAARWEAIKATEKPPATGSRSALAGIPVQLPALQRATKVTGRAFRTGMAKPGPEELLESLRTGLQDLENALQQKPVPDLEKQYGDLLFTLATLAHHMGDAEDALRRSVDRFCERFSRAEIAAGRQGRPVADILNEKKGKPWTPDSRGKQFGTRSRK